MIFSLYVNVINMDPIKTRIFHLYIRTETNRVRIYCVVLPKQEKMRIRIGLCLGRGQKSDLVCRFIYVRSLVVWFNSVHGVVWHCFTLWILLLLTQFKRKGWWWARGFELMCVFVAESVTG